LDHDIALRGYGYALRPVRPEDAALIVALRNEGGPYINRGAQDEREQRAWISRYLEREGDYYFVAERMRDARPDGLAAIYDVDAQARRAEWGRFVVRHTNGDGRVIEYLPVIEFQRIFKTSPNMRRPSRTGLICP